MERRKCNNSGLELSVLGTGCWTFGGGEYWGSQDQQDVNEVVRASIDFGINYFDTAEVYNEGRSETSLGMAISGIPRNKFLIGSKVSPSNCYKDILIEHCEASLKRLGTDYIDIYMIHWPIHPHSIRHFTSDVRIIQNPPTIDEALEDLIKLKEQGKIRFFGVSNFSSNRLKDFPLEQVAVNELPYNLLCRAIEYDTLDMCQRHGIGVIGYMALLQGILAGTYPTLAEVPSWRRRTRHFNCKGTRECRHGEAGIEDETNEALTEIRRISKETGIKMNDLAIKWILANPAITCTLAGSRNVIQLKENIKATEFDLDTEIKKELDRVTFPVMEKLGNHFDYYESANNDRTV
jgi:aryl-alcohol dehydrogenase-like predicted oxidoreductase